MGLKGRHRSALGPTGPIQGSYGDTLRPIGALCNLQKCCLAL